MQPESAAAYMPAVLQVLEGNGPVMAEPGNNYEENTAMAVNPLTGQRFSCMKFDARFGWRYEGFRDAPKGSVAVISIHDAIMKYDYCGAWGTNSLVNVLKDAEASDNIIGILLDMDTPGGEVYGTKNLHDAVANCSKPVIAHVNDGYCASAGMYIACAADKLLMSQPTDQVGSIGVYTTLIDPTGAYEAKGYKVKTIYSPLSPKKNGSYKAAMDKENPDDEPMSAELAFLDQTFMDCVKAGRPNVTDEALEGGMFYTDEAIKMGLCDGYATQAEAIEMCVNLSGSSQIFS
jgi:protease-4